MRYTQFSGEPIVQDRAEYEALKARIDALDARFRAGVISEASYLDRRAELVEAATREVGFSQVVSVMSIEGGKSEQALPPDIGAITADDLAELKDLIGSLTQPAFAFDAEGKLTAWNTLFQEAAGYSSESNSAWPFTNGTYDENGRKLTFKDSPTYECWRTRKIVRGRKVALETHDGTRILGACYPTPIWSRSTGRFLGVVTVWVPLTDARCAKPQLRVHRGVASWAAIAASLTALTAFERLLTRVDLYAAIINGVDWYTAMFGLAPVA